MKKLHVWKRSDGWIVGRNRSIPDFEFGSWKSAVSWASTHKFSTELYMFVPA